MGVIGGVRKLVWRWPKRAFEEWQQKGDGLPMIDTAHRELL